MSDICDEPWCLNSGRHEPCCRALSSRVHYPCEGGSSERSYEPASWLLEVKILGSCLEHVGDFGAGSELDFVVSRNFLSMRG